MVVFHLVVLVCVHLERRDVILVAGRCGGVLGFADPLLYLSMLNYITDSYPNVAGSAVAAFLIPSFLIATAFAHIGIILFENLSSTWAVATLAFISLGLVVLVYILYCFGPRLRMASKLARSV